MVEMRQMGQLVANQLQNPVRLQSPEVEGQFPFNATVPIFPHGLPWPQLPDRLQSETMLVGIVPTQRFDEKPDGGSGCGGGFHGVESMVGFFIPRGED